MSALLGAFHVPPNSALIEGIELSKQGCDLSIVLTFFFFCHNVASLIIPYLKYLGTLKAN